MENDRAHKAHRPPQSGAKAEKKKKGKQRTGINEKAFAPKSGRRADRQGRRNAERDQARLHVPLVSRVPEDSPPPIIVAIVGPPGVGKTTLLKSLVRRHTKQTLTVLKGPITVVGGKRRRLTFVECNNDSNSMIDIGKVADLVLLMIDGSFGFEMETFEFLNILQSHGFPKVIGVLTHLDLIKKAATLRAQKKTLKKRFWTEIYDGAKLFYLSGVRNGRYPDNEIHNLSRFISVMKFRPLVFQNAHPYILADRVEDLTPREQIRQSKGKCDRTITLYGYLHGTNLRPSMKVHIPGVGDLDIKTVNLLGDPCPLPDATSEKKRKLSESKKLLVHAPMSDVGGVMYDKDAVWINVPGSFTRGEMDVPRGEGEQMVIDMQDVNNTLDEAIARSKIKLLESSSMHLAVEQNQADSDSDDGAGDSEDDDSDESMESGIEGDPDDISDGVPVSGGSDAEQNSNPGDDIEYANSDSDLGEGHDGHRVHYEDEEEGSDIPTDEEEGPGDEGDWEDEAEEAPRWKANLPSKALANFQSSRKAQPKNWTKLIYFSELAPNQILQNEPASESALDDSSDDFFRIKPGGTASDEGVDMTNVPASDSDLRRWEDEDMLDLLRKFFITGPVDQPAPADDDGDAMEASDAGDDPGGEPHSVDTEAARAAALAAKKEVLKRKFDEQYDDPTPTVDFYTEKKEEMARQLQLNRAELADIDPESRMLVEGFRPGSYVRVEFDSVPCELIENFDPAYPVVVGGLLPAEQQFGYVQVRIKRHRWHTRTLKTNDPLILSLGWRRFQTIPTYSLDDHSIRMRMLKYTPEHMHCYATFYGPVALPNTGFCAFSSLHGESSFRISAAGVVIDIERSVKIVKKLKLTGVPYKIFKNTAFVKDMFNSALEAAKFEGATIRTVSGVRGQIKKAMSKPDGAFRATFEDKVLKSDIVFLRAWYSVQPRKFYNPVTSLLLSDKSRWTGMRLTGQVRRDEGLKTPLNVNSTYKRITRIPRRFNPLKIPTKLQASLPYASKPKLMKPQHKQTYMQKRAVVMEPEEKKAVALLQQIRALRKDQVARRKEKQKERKSTFLKKVQKEEEKKNEKEKEKRKEYMREAGIKNKRKAEVEEGRKSKKRKA